MFPPPQIPNRYDDDAQRLKRLEAQEQQTRRRTLLLILGGVLILIALIPLWLLGWSGAGLMLVPIGLGVVLLAGLQLLLAGSGD